jgi:hypothetical protein
VKSPARLGSATIGQVDNHTRRSLPADPDNYTRSPTRRSLPADPDSYTRSPRSPRLGEKIGRMDGLRRSEAEDRDLIYNVSHLSDHNSHHVSHNSHHVSHNSRHVSHNSHQLDHNPVARKTLFSQDEASLKPTLRPPVSVSPMAVLSPAQSAPNPLLATTEALLSALGRGGGSGGGVGGSNTKSSTISYQTLRQSLWDSPPEGPETPKIFWGNGNKNGNGSGKWEEGISVWGSGGDGIGAAPPRSLQGTFGEHSEHSGNFSGNVSGNVPYTFPESVAESLVRISPSAFKGPSLSPSSLGSPLEVTLGHSRWKTGGTMINVSPVGS